MKNEKTRRKKVIPYWTIQVKKFAKIRYNAWKSLLECNDETREIDRNEILQKYNDADANMKKEIMSAKNEAWKQTISCINPKTNSSKLWMIFR